MEAAGDGWWGLEKALAPLGLETAGSPRFRYDDCDCLLVCLFFKLESLLPSLDIQ